MRHYVIHDTMSFRLALGQPLATGPVILHAVLGHAQHHLKNAWDVSEGVWEVSGRCPGNVWEVPGECLGSV